jgi:gamma-glutamyl phosphate reductase
MTQAKHTPGPWESAYSVHGARFLIRAERGAVIGEVWHSAAANAAFIVKACNAHDRLTAERDELVAALRDMLNLYDGRMYSMADHPERVAAARAALAKVQA